eukprot:TRINITY_DN22677_c0_g3_i1.p1 TRINITY_DN22677_c0_g3~~TRINITY_DN22677_c0_g3_i1.p1  ORF type:complete len:214 (+),score=39.40 TRINITY_DN22677_c0_g3_i1:162-803(+)
MLDHKQVEAKKRSFDVEEATGRRKVEGVKDKFMSILSVNKILISPTLFQYGENIKKYAVDYVEHKHHNKYCAVNVIGKELFIEIGSAGNGNKTVTKKTFEDHQTACEEAIEFVSRKIAEGYKRPYKSKEYHIDRSISAAEYKLNSSEEQKKSIKNESIDNSSVKKEEEKSTEVANGSGEDGDTDLLLSELDDDELQQIISESMNDLESRCKSN